MKRPYSKPVMCWQPVRSSHAIADICWGFANNGKKIYYNTYGTGYAELTVVGKKCTKDVTFQITYLPETMTLEERAMADADMQRVIANIMATMPDHTTPFKGSPFVTAHDPSWS